MASPGGPAHVMLTDRQAEHIPGCNMAFYKWALAQVGGFDPIYHRAGDDVDLCWRLQQAGFKLFIVSNQSGVGRGYFTLADVEKVNEHLMQELGREQVRFEKIYIAPEAPDAPSRGRKPSPQFLLDARDEFDVDLAQSYMIGDKLIDLECGWNAVVKKCLLVRTGYGAELERASADKLGAAAVVDDLSAAAEWILAQA